VFKKRKKMKICIKYLLRYLLLIIMMQHILFAGTIKKKIWVPVDTGEILTYIPYLLQLPDKDNDGIEDELDRPVALAQEVTVDIDADGYDIKLSGYDNDSAITYHIATQPKHGQLTGEVPDMRYIPDAEFEGEDTFSFFVDDGVHTSERVTVTIHMKKDSDTEETPDTTPPTIILQGEVNVTLMQGDTYNDAGATANDDHDGDITEDIVTVSDVNTSKVGTYHVTYNISDHAGNAADEVVREVNVVPDTDKKIFIIGDSTVRYDLDGDRDVNGSLHRTGWGSKLSAYAIHPENIFNRARRSAIAGGVEDNVHSYRRDAAIDEWVATHKGPYDWNTTKALIEEADTSNGAFLLIQFGANDKYADIDEEAFKSHLQFYIDQAHSLGITPILLTPINPKSTLNDTRTPYTGYIRDVGASNDVPIIDLHAHSLEIYADYTLKQRYGLFGAWKLDGTHDTTHLNQQGATIVADWVKDLACVQESLVKFCEQLDSSKAYLYAYAGEDQNITTEEAIDLNGSGIDTDGEIIAYRWEENGEVLSEERTLHFASNIIGEHALTLYVTSDDGDEATDTLTINIRSKDAVDRIVLEDAEDGNTDGWGLYGETENATITNVVDDVRGSRVIVLSGDDGLDNGFSFTNHDISDHPIVSWAMRYNESFKFFVKVRTTNADHDPLYIYYAPDATKPTYEEVSGKKYIHVGLGSFASTDNWIDFSRDVQADLQSVFPDENLSLIYGFYVRGSGSIDDISVTDRGGEYPARSGFFEQSTSVTDRADFNVSYPGSVFGAHITRITDRATQTANTHPYPKQGSAWNSDGTILRMQYRLYDAKTFAELPVTAGLDAGQAYAKIGSPAHGSADIRWSKNDPNLMYVLDSSQHYKQVVLNPQRTDMTQTSLIDLSTLGYANITTGNNEGNLDYDDKYIVFAAKKDDSDTVYALLYRIGEAGLTWTKVVSRGVWDGEGEHYFDWISIDPSAHYILVSSEEKIWLYDMNLDNEVELDDYAGHGDIGIDTNGDPTYVQMIYGGTAIRSYNLRTHAATDLLPSNYGGGHISCRNYKRPGWCYVNTSQEGYKEVFALRLDPDAPGTVERFAQTHVSDDRHGLAQVNVSPDGTKVLFGSDWGDTDNALDTYHVKMEE
jgi:lysophospholipase L1-like esterase